MLSVTCCQRESCTLIPWNVRLTACDTLRSIRGAANRRAKFVYARFAFIVLVALSAPALAVAQPAAPHAGHHAVEHSASRTPTADAFRVILKRVQRRLIASAEEMPEAKYTYKPTTAQMTVAEIVVHLAEDNDGDCSRISGVKAPARTPISPTDTKARLVERLKQTFAFCDQTLASLDDTQLAEEVSADGEMETRIQAMMDDCGHWADHYSQFAIYLRLNGLQPPTATDPSM